MCEYFEVNRTRAQLLKIVLLRYVHAIIQRLIEMSFARHMDPLLLPYGPYFNVDTGNYRTDSIFMHDNTALGLYQESVSMAFRR